MTCGWLEVLGERADGRVGAKDYHPNTITISTMNHQNPRDHPCSLPANQEPKSPKQWHKLNISHLIPPTLALLTRHPTIVTNEPSHTRRLLPTQFAFLQSGALILLSGYRAKLSSSDCYLRGQDGFGMGRDGRWRWRGKRESSSILNAFSYVGAAGGRREEHPNTTLLDVGWL